jgi:hypothetical protein
VCHALAAVDYLLKIHNPSNVAYGSRLCENVRYDRIP